MWGIDIQVRKRESCAICAVALAFWDLSWHILDEISFREGGGVFSGLSFSFSSSSVPVLSGLYLVSISLDTREEGDLGARGTVKSGKEQVDLLVNSTIWTTFESIIYFVWPFRAVIN